MNDLKFAFRQLLKNPGFTAVAVLTLALGIGANTAIFSVVNAVLLRPLPYKSPEGIVTVLLGGWAPVAPADFLDWQKQQRSFEHLAAAQYWGGTFTGRDRPEVVTGLGLGEGLFELLGIQPLLGRTFLPEEFQAGKERVLVLTHKLWQRRFGGDTNVLGQTVTLSGDGYTIVGVMPPNFQFAPFWATRAEMYAPLTLAGRLNDRSGLSLRIFGRLKAGVTRSLAQADMNTICKRLESAYPDTNTGRSARVDPLLEKVVGDIRPALLVLLGAVAFVLLIACANVANLLLVRAAAREKEMAVRAALGASRWRTIRQLLTESVLLSLIAGVLGLLVGVWTVGVLKAILADGASGIPRVQEIAVDGAALGFTFFVALLTGVVFGSAPALQAAKPDLQNALKESGRGATGGRRASRLRSAFVVGEMALALVMLVGAGLLMRSFLRLSAVDPGFNPKNVLTMTISLPGDPEWIGAKRETFYRELFQRIEGLPGVQSASSINHLPLAGDIWGLGITIEGRPLPPPGQRLSAVFRVCWPKYFQTMGIRLVKGRDFTEQDRLGTPGVVIINESLARRRFPNEDPIGKRITFDDPTQGQPNWLTIVGIARDARQHDWGAREVQDETYTPFLQSKAYLDTFGDQTLVIRTQTNPRTLFGSVEAAVWSFNKDIPTSIATLDEVVSNAVWQPRFNLILIGVFAGLALVLAALGIYGVLAYAVAQRAHEIGIRMALGAQKRDVLQLVICNGMTLAGIGLGIGVASAFGLTRLMAKLLYEVQATDPLTFVGVAVVLGTVALLACYLPARRATRVDPMETLRYE